PIYGLYGSFVPLLVYGLLGSSRQLAIGPVAITALLMFAGVSQIAAPESPEYIGLIILVGLLVGLGQVLLAAFRLGFLVHFISHPVIVGFTSAAAIVIGINQLSDSMGIEIPRFDKSFNTLGYALSHLEQTHLPTLFICIFSIVLMWGLKKIHKAIPGALFAVVLSSLLVYVMDDDHVIAMVDSVPSGLPGFSLPSFSFEQAQSLLPTILSVTTIGIVESIGIAKVLETKRQDHRIRPNQELWALGLSKTMGAFFQSMPSSASFSRSAINCSAGANSGTSSITTALFVALALIFLTPLFAYLPKAALSAIILMAISSLVDFDEVKRLGRAHRRDFVMLLITFFITLLVGIEEGVLTGVVLSVFLVLYRSSKPHIAVLGKLPGSQNYRNIDRFDLIEKSEDALIVRFDDQLYFGNAAYFQDSLMRLAKPREESLRLIVLDASSIHDIDSTGFDALSQVIEYFNERNIRVCLAGMIGPVRDKIARTGFVEKIGQKNQFLSVHDAITACEKGEGGWTTDAIQSNTK
ncbi:MAG: sulfate permease, partial [Saprospiraceae bacterium]|nr:sulfate permease [Saprospiraceae bacterium]